MPPRPPCLARIARPHAFDTQWQRRTCRCYTSAATDPPWFQQLRTDMLGRDATSMVEVLTHETEDRLAATLAGFLPAEWCRPAMYKGTPIPVGHHLLGWNPVVPARDVLPDGTDALQSPGAPWSRRMWAGGSVRLRPEDYYMRNAGFAMGAALASVERIQDVKLRGTDDSAKLFVTIERRFARLTQLQRSYNNAHGIVGKQPRETLLRHFALQMRHADDWGDAVLKEERTLVFLKDKTQAELDAITHGQTAPIRYLSIPGQPQCSHTLTPTRSLLFRFSALTFNAHLIHLDRDYARTVEGHRNLLVHGPLSLVLLLHVVDAFINARSEGSEVLHSIEYRNLAPLYCDEKMRICASARAETSFGVTYDVWIEGPTGGIAVKGTVHTVMQSATLPASITTSSGQATVAPSIRAQPEKLSPENSEASHQGRHTDVREEENIQKKSRRKSALDDPCDRKKRVARAERLGQSIVRKIESNGQPIIPRTPRLIESKGQGHSLDPTVVRNDQFAFVWRHRKALDKSNPELECQAPSLQDLHTVLAPHKTPETLRNTVSADASSQFPSENQVFGDDTPKEPKRENPRVSLIRTIGRVHRRNRPLRLTSYQFITESQLPAPIRQINSTQPAKPVMSLQSRSLMRRLAPQKPTDVSFEPIPLVRKVQAKPDQRNAIDKAHYRSRFGRQGVRRFEKPAIRAIGMELGGRKLLLLRRWKLARRKKRNPY